VFFFQAEDGIRDDLVTGVQTCALPILTQDDAAGYTVKGVLARDNENIPLSEPPLLIAGLAFFRDRVARFDDGNMFPWVQMLRTRSEERRVGKEGRSRR